MQVVFAAAAAAAVLSTASTWNMYPVSSWLQIGMHFMNPVPIMALVELAKGLHTSQQTFEACKGLAEYLGKQVATSQDRPVSNQVT
jgi:3-hydroxyacyl-CoA dehydrogenase